MMRVLIVRLGAIGDVVHTLPALASLRQAFPTAHIGWVVQKGAAASLLRDNPYLDELIEVDLRNWSATIASGEIQRVISSPGSQLRVARFDTALDFQGLLKSSAIPWLARIPRRIGFAFNALREPLAGLLLTDRVPVNDDDHIIQKNLSLLSALGIVPQGTYQFPIQAAPGDRAFVEQYIPLDSDGFAILNPGGGWPTKLWDSQRFALIADHLWTHRQIASLITYGPGEEQLAEQITSKARTSHCYAVRTSLTEFYVLARRARLFVGGDTGPMHLAAAAGAPIVALFGPTSSRRNGPFDPNDIVVERSDLECRVDCYRRKCDHCSCMDLPTEMVWKGVLARLDSVDHSLQSTAQSTSGIRNRSGNV